MIKYILQILALTGVYYLIVSFTFYEFPVDFGSVRSTDRGAILFLWFLFVIITFVLLMAHEAYKDEWEQND